MKKTLLFFFIASPLLGFSQTVFYNQDFEGTHNWTLNVTTGTEGADPNFFTVSDNEGGVAPGGCGVATNGNKTLHVTSVFMSSAGASYDAGGLCGFLYCPQTDRRAESPTIDCSGRTNITLSFDFISLGDGLNDNASVYYYNGTTWAVLENSIKSTVCGGGQGLWTAHSVALPSSANNNPNVRIAFRWVNNDDGVGSDPSFAVNDVKLYTPSTLATSISSSTNVFCNGDQTGSATISATGGTAPYTYLWNTGATSATINNLAAGTYSCVVTDNTGATSNQSVTITEPAAISSSQNFTLCAGESITVGNNTYTQTGLYTDVLSAINGCDSTVYTTITVANPVDVSVTINNTTLTAGLNGAQYAWYNCQNNQVILGANNQSYTPATTGSYAVIVTTGNCSDTSICNTISVLGITNTLPENIQLYPNPTNDILHLSIPDKMVIEVFDPTGKLCLIETRASGAQTISLETLETGSYLLQLTSENGSSFLQRIVKNN